MGNSRKTFIAILSLTAVMLSAAPIKSSAIKEVLIGKLASYQSKADGLYSISNGALRVGKHSVELNPVIETEREAQGVSVVAMRIEISIDGVRRVEAASGAIGIASNKEAAIAVGLDEWYLGFGQTFFQAMAEKEPSMVLDSHEVFVGVPGIRNLRTTGPLNSIERSDERDRKILNALLPALSRKANMAFLVLNVVVPPSGKPLSECRVGTVVSTAMNSRLEALDWPRTADGYIFRQTFVLRKKKS
jgi:hypothetical protein